MRFYSPLVYPPLSLAARPPHSSPKSIALHPIDMLSVSKMAKQVAILMKLAAIKSSVKPSN
ncbi:hypothetical protein B0681_10285 [Moraxella porci DSM 25326]|uniref:Uncharacterized protein n=1 Tax=Moraxella porci DSM 25326 TaxID=573983 RepID=A0A1T0CJY4_9GAMM|nr:hypothetical protein B0681_10285 [Moraxella porci DSM 25326]